MRKGYIIKRNESIIILTGFYKRKRLLNT